MKMLKHTIKRSTEYTIVPNSVITDSSISAEARLVHIYLLSRPDDWSAWRTDIMNVCSMGKDKYNRVMRELRESSYVELNIGGDGGGTALTVYETPDLCGKSDSRETRQSEKAITAKPDSIQSKDLLLSNDDLSSKDKAYVQNEFERWWSQYPIKRGKKPALTVWKRIKPDADLLIADTINKTENDDGWLRGFAPNPTTYLNQERWNDELQSPKPAELTIDQQVGIRQQRTAAIIRKLNGCDVGVNEPPLLAAMDEGEW